MGDDIHEGYVTHEHNKTENILSPWVVSILSFEALTCLSPIEETSASDASAYFETIKITLTYLQKQKGDIAHIEEDIYLNYIH